MVVPTARLRTLRCGHQHHGCEQPRRRPFVAGVGQWDLPIFGTLCSSVISITDSLCVCTVYRVRIDRTMFVACLSVTCRQLCSWFSKTI